MAPSLPSPPPDNSPLTQRFGPETANYFSGNPLNRLSFMREDSAFLHAAFSHPSARFLLLRTLLQDARNNLASLAPLVSAEDTDRLAYVAREDVVPLVGEGPLAKSEKELVKEYDSREEQVVVVFLGVDETGDAGKVDGDVFQHNEFRGVPYFAIDVTPRGGTAAAAEALIEKLKERGLVFYEHSPRHMGLEPKEAAIYGHARALIDWNLRTPYCAQCGQPTLSVQGGAKRVCPPTDKAGPRRDCGSRGTVSNHSFPRTDPTVIVAVLSADGTRVLLGRQRRWPKDWYSTLAGFQEPGESIEEAVRREVWEESGVRVGRVVLHSSQPWPFPASLMIGAIAQALPGDGENIYLGHDPELESAKWFPLEEVREALLRGTSGLGEGPPKGYVEGSLRLPPQTAIANRLLTAVVEGWWIPSKM
ncbi:hypothetical protein VTJ83DRAFT_2524 [Remersonia thermophila]|uniref:NAD(+) diphosphatase n=1 Tax=Remersonia thermophila TaxID=72144 RepID=A0ABR4DJ18_9PEZI